MKSEFLWRALGGIDADLIEAAEARPSSYGGTPWIKRGAAAAAALAVLLGALTLPRLLRQKAQTEITTLSLPAESSHPEDSASPESSQPEDLSGHVIWASSDSEVGEEWEDLQRWNGKYVSHRLYDALERAQDGDIFAIRALPVIDGDYVFQGKTLAVYYLEMSEESNLPEKLAQLLKVGDALKYGDQLYLTGTPEGEKWYEELYHETVDFFGEDLLSEYIVDGQFLKEKLQEDLEASSQKTDAAEAYKEARAAYLAETVQALPCALPAQRCPYDDNCFILFFSRQAFLQLSFDPDPSGAEWLFDSALPPSCDEERYGTEE